MTLWFWECRCYGDKKLQMVFLSTACTEMNTLVIERGAKVRADLYLLFLITEILSLANGNDQSPQTHLGTALQNPASQPYNLHVESSIYQPLRETHRRYD